MSVRGTILIVEDNKEINQLLSDFLKSNDFETILAYNGREASDCFKKTKFDLVLMDLMLPYKSGSDLIQELRQYSQVPVICISAKSGMDTRLEVLRMGADDYIIKPFDLNEVLVRVEVVLRRTRSVDVTDENKGNVNVLSVGNLELDVTNNCARIKGKPLPLTAKEFAILKLMIENPAKTFSKANLYESVWEEDYCYEDNTLNVHMSNLRNKLKKADDSREYISTVWGIGYRLFQEKKE